MLQYDRVYPVFGMRTGLPTPSCWGVRPWAASTATSFSQADITPASWVGTYFCAIDIAFVACYCCITCVSSVTDFAMQEAARVRITRSFMVETEVILSVRRGPSVI